MIEVLWHGRGGQGAFTAARLLGAAASLDDKRHALAFPSFGPERRGAPMRAFTKIDTVQIGDRSAVSKADFVIYLDGTLLAPGWERELKPGGICLVNTAEALDDPRLLAIDADGLATELLGRPIPNTVFLGALAQLADAWTARAWRRLSASTCPQNCTRATSRWSSAPSRWSSRQRLPGMWMLALANPQFILAKR